MGNLSKYKAVIGTLKALDGYDVEALSELLKQSFIFSFANNFSKESIDDSLILENRITGDSNDFMFLKFILCTLLVDAVRYASRMKSPSEFTWEKFLVWYADA